MGYLHKLRQSMHSSENRDHLKYQAKRVRLSKETLAQVGITCKKIFRKEVWFTSFQILSAAYDVTRTSSVIGIKGEKWSMKQAQRQVNTMVNSV